METACRRPDPGPDEEALKGALYKKPCLNYISTF